MHSTNRISETEEKRRDTLRLIAEAGYMISLHRLPDPVSDGAGGTIYPGDGDRVPLPPVRRYFSGVNFQFTGFELQTAYGERRKVPYVLVGTHDDDIREDDVFWFSGQLMKVKYVMPDKTYETKAEVHYEGDRNTGDHGPDA